MNIKLVACDMDYTLLKNNGELPPGFDNYINRLKNKGVQFAVASGRPGYTLQELFPKYKDDFYFISDNGAAIKYQGEFIYKSLMSYEIIQELIHTVIETNTGLPIICGLDGGYFPLEGKKYETFFSRFFSKRYPVEDILAVHPEANKFTIYCKDGNAKEIMEKVYNPKFSEELNVTLGGDVWIDIMNKNINKGSAIKQLKTFCQIEKENIMAFGDHLNDYEMLEYVPNSYAMENAIPEIKAVAKYMAPSNEEHGVLQVLDKTIL